MEMSNQAVRAGRDAPFLERFITAHQPFILRAASRYAGRAVMKTDDEYSVALIAFYEAVRGYRPESGAFGAFAALVIGRRLADYYRSQHRFDAEVLLAPQVFDGDIDEDGADASLQYAVHQQMANEQTGATSEEMEAADAQCAEYGFSFYDLETCAPQTEKTRRACAKAIRVLFYSATLFASLQNTRCLPVTALAQESGVSKKLIDRHRKFIIAAALLLDGDYPFLSSYLKSTISACR